MAPQTALLRNATRYAVRYGPIALALAQQARGPAQDAARRAWETQRARRLADDHARTLRQGSVLAVVHEGSRHWVVFTGEDPLIVYPATQVPLEVLMQHADMDLRRPPAPESSGTLRRIQRMGGRAGRDAGEPPVFPGAEPPSPAGAAAGDAGSGGGTGAREGDPDRGGAPPQALQD